MVDPTPPIELSDPTPPITLSDPTPPITLSDPTSAVPLSDPTDPVSLIDAGVPAALRSSSEAVPLVRWTEPLVLFNPNVAGPFGVPEGMASKQSAGAPLSKPVVELRRVDPWLRMVANGSSSVNAQRARVSACVTTTRGPQEKSNLLRGFNAELAELKPPEQRPKLGSKEATRATDASVNVFVEMRDDEPETRNSVAPLLRRCKRRGKLLYGQMSIADLTSLSEHKAVRSIQRAQSLRFDQALPRWSGHPQREPSAQPRRGESDNSGVMIGVIDVGGFDFAHPDFLDQQGQTRFTAIWDMGAEGGAPAGFHYGKELDHATLEAEINSSKGSGRLQSQQETGSHGTHVASIAAGNSGMCPGAEIAAVLLDLPKPKDDDRRRAQVFCDSSRIADAVEYLCALADLRRKPISINISLATNGGPHDGSGPISRWLEEVLASPGHCICVAAGNASCSGPLSVNVKFAGNPEGQPTKQLVVIGPVHGGGQIAGAGLEKELQWVVQGNGVADLAEHNLEIWYSALDRMAVAVLPPR